MPENEKSQEELEQERLAAEAAAAEAGGEGADGENPEGTEGAAAEVTGEGGQDGGGESGEQSWEDDPDYQEYRVVGAGGSGAGADEDKFKKVPSEEYESLVADANLYRKLKANPTVFAAIMHFEAGGTVEQLAGAVDTTDYKALDGKELFLLDLRRKYGNKFTSDMEEEAIGEWDSMSNFKRLDMAQSLAEKYESDKANKAGAFAKAVLDYQKDADTLSKKLTEEFDGVLHHWAKKGSYLGMPFDEHKVAKVRQFIRDTGGNIIMENGKPSAKLYFQAVAGILFKFDIAKAKKVEGVRKGVESVAAATQNTGGGAKPAVPGNPGAKASVRNAYEEYQKKKLAQKK
jgi:hypothetical protein